MPNQQFSTQVLDFGAFHHDNAVSTGIVLGISPTAIKGAVLEEFNGRQSVVGNIFQPSADYYAQHAPVVGLRTHTDVVLAVRDAGDAGRAGNFDLGKVGNPALIDVGPGNIQIYTAVGLLEDYLGNASNFRNDPLGLKKYAGNYDDLVDDLINPTSDATIKIAGLMVERAFSWGEANVANWNSLTASEKEGFSVYFYNVGEEYMDNKAAESVAANGEYNVDIDNTDLAQEYMENKEAIEERAGRTEEACFLPGTPITLADGVTTKPIEEIAPGDEVLSYTDDGTLVPGRVTATSSKTASIVLDWFGLGVTPGHVTLCGTVPGEETTPAGPFMGRHVPLIDILCADGAVVRQDGSLVRAATNEPVGSRADAFVRLAYSRTGEELKAGVSHEASIRSGTKLITGEGNTVRVLDVIEANGYAFDEETGLVSRPLDDGTPGIAGPLPFFGMPPRPEDHVLARSGTTLEAIHTAGEWEGEGSQLPAPTPARATPPAAMSPPMNRKQRRALMAKGRRAH